MKDEWGGISFQSEVFVSWLLMRHFQREMKVD